MVFQSEHMVHMHKNNMITLFSFEGLGYIDHHRLVIRQRVHLSDL